MIYVSWNICCKFQTFVFNVLKMWILYWKEHAKNFEINNFWSTCVTSWIFEDYWYGCKVIEPWKILILHLMFHINENGVLNQQLLLKSHQGRHFYKKLFIIHLTHKSIHSTWSVVPNICFYFENVELYILRSI